MKVVMQDGAKDCGICCLLSIIRHYKGEVPKEYLRKLTNTTKDGVNLYSLLEASKKLGFDAVGMSGKLEDINVNNLPCIAHININKKYKHFVVIYKIDARKSQVSIMDPAKGKKTLSFSEYNLLTTSNYLFIKPIKKLPILNKKNIILKSAKRILQKNKKEFILISFLTINFFILNMVISMHFKYLLELSINYNISDNILIISLILFSTYLLKNTIGFIKNVMMYKCNSIFQIEITTITYKQILLLPYYYFKNRTTGEIISRFRDLDTIREYLVNFFYTMLTDVVSLIIFTIVMFKYSNKLTLIVIISLIFMAFFIISFSKAKKKKLKKIKLSEDLINSYLIQGISNVDTVKGSHLEKRFIDKFEINYKLLQERIYSFLKLSDSETFIKELIKSILYVIVYGLGSYYVIREKITLPNFIVYQSFITYSQANFQNIITLISNYNTYKIAKERVEELFMLEEENFTNNYFYLPYNLQGDIIIKNLNYKVGCKVIFDNLNLEIKKGEKVLLSGDSGAGKSTLVKMLLRYIDTSFSSIEIAGIDINHYHLQNIRSNITYITNNEFLFNDTIKNNITTYNECDDEKLNEICNITCIQDILKENGLDTMIEENGFNISNGERQRLILARALLRDSSIYIFDEALSQIDILKEKKILENIFKYMPNKTIIVISHRFNNKKLFDRTLKLEKGKIIDTKKL